MQAIRGRADGGPGHGLMQVQPGLERLHIGIRQVPHVIQAPLELLIGFAMAWVFGQPPFKRRLLRGVQPFMAARRPQRGLEFHRVLRPDEGLQLAGVLVLSWRGGRGGGSGRFHGCLWL